ncbi:MAG TPA: hypothetical protein VKF35_10505 [Hyphomicrobiaceae bacterium]|nr:hypothetical protein [Hyphomicrobiaceae bacterium]
MQSKVASSGVEMGARARFVPASLVFIFIHILFVATAILLAAID